MSTKTSGNYKAEAYEALGEIVRGASTMSQDELHQKLNRFGELSRLAGMAEVAERAMSNFVFESKIARV